MTRRDATSIETLARLNARAMKNSALIAWLGHPRQAVRDIARTELAARGII